MRPASKKATRPCRHHVVRATATQQQQGPCHFRRPLFVEENPPRFHGHLNGHGHAAVHLAYHSRSPGGALETAGIFGPRKPRHGRWLAKLVDAAPVAGTAEQQTLEGRGNGRYWTRTSDLHDVNVAL